MFDAPPPNLPVEPLKPLRPPEPSMMPSAPEPSPPSGGAKEPEDIFSGLDREAETSPAPVMRPSGSRGGSLGKTIAVILIVLLVVGGIGFGVWYFLLRAAASPEISSPPPTADMPVVVPSQPEPVVEIPPVVEPTMPELTVPPATTTSEEPENPLTPPAPLVAEPGL
ncbi:hypothetical protein L0Y59_05285, partial [Candidatus Uhrbacteria bacterium]|nr:hypothetical protein [Candidatus Uhrbacteria bacterium]